MKNPLPQDWPFIEPQNVAVFTTRKVVSGDCVILYVSHDADDGAWQFHSGVDSNEDDPKIISLREVIRLDPSLLELADLPLGWIAIRKSQDDSWQRHKGQ